MQSLRKRIQAQAHVARANLDAAILGLRNTSLEQLKEKLEQTRSRLDSDTAWSLATRVLEKVRSVRESLQAATPAKPRVRTAARPAAKTATRKPKSTGAKKRSPKSSSRAPKRAH